MSEINIYNEDCIEGLKKIADESIDCVITDPPYGINYVSNHYKNGNPFSPIINDHVLFIPLDELWRLLKPSGCMFIFYSPKVPLVDSRIKNNIIWVKNNGTAGDLEGDFGYRYECIAYIPKPDFKIKHKRYSNVWHFDRVPPDKLKHPTQKPIDLIRRMVLCGTNEGDLILDPFIGSGTTAQACKELGRRCIGFELNPNYCQIAKERIKQQTLTLLTH